jgi:hypothetical protein
MKRAGGAVLNKKGDAAGSNEYTDLTPTSPTYSENNFSRSPLPISLPRHHPAYVPEISRDLK